MSRDKPGYHYFKEEPAALGTVAEGMTEEMVKEALLRFAVPGQDPAVAVEHGKIYPVFPPIGDHYSVGNVQTTIGDDGMSITNEAQKGHIFYPGKIRREVHLRDGTWYVTTTGWGNNERAFMDKTNQNAGPVAFGIVDDQMKRYLQHQIQKR